MCLRATHKQNKTNSNTATNRDTKSTYTTLSVLFFYLLSPHHQQQPEPWHVPRGRIRRQVRARNADCRQLLPGPVWRLRSAGVREPGFVPEVSDKLRTNTIKHTHKTIAAQKHTHTLFPVVAMKRREETEVANGSTTHLFWHHLAIKSPREYHRTTDRQTWNFLFNCIINGLFKFSEVNDLQSKLVTPPWFGSILIFYTLFFS